RSDLHRVGLLQSRGRHLSPGARAMGPASRGAEAGSRDVLVRLADHVRGRLRRDRGARARAARQGARPRLRGAGLAGSAGHDRGDHVYSQGLLSSLAFAVAAYAAVTAGRQPMRRTLRTASIATGLAVLLALGSAPRAVAGGTGLDDDMDTETGSPFFGFVKD